MIHRTLLHFCFLLVLASSPMHARAGLKATLVAPRAEGPTQVEFSTNPVSKWTDLPLGTYRVPNSDVIISGHQKGGATGLLFGVIGITIQHSVNAHNGKEAMASAEQALTLSIDEEAKSKLQAAMADPAFASTFSTDATGDRKFEVMGSVVLSFTSATDVQPYVVLRVKLLKNGKSKLWTTRYIASQGARKPLVGEGSWTADGGAVLRPHVSSLLDLAINTMLKDIATPYPRDEASLTTVRGYFPHVNKPLQVVGYKLSEDDGRMLFLPNMGTTVVFAGVNILDTSSLISHKPMVKGDAVLKLLKPKDLALASQTATLVEPAVTDSEGTTEVPADTDAGAIEEVDESEAAGQDS